MPSFTLLAASSKLTSLLASCRVAGIQCHLLRFNNEIAAAPRGVTPPSSEQPIHQAGSGLRAWTWKLWPHPGTSIAAGSKRRNSVDLHHRILGPEARCSRSWPPASRSSNAGPPPKRSWGPRHAPAAVLFARRRAHHVGVLRSEPVRRRQRAENRSAARAGFEPATGTSPRESDFSTSASLKWILTPKPSTAFNRDSEPTAGGGQRHHGAHRVRDDRHALAGIEEFGDIRPRCWP